MATPTPKQVRKTLDAALARTEPGLRRAVLRALRSVQGSVSVKQLSAAIAREDAFAFHELANTLPTKLRPAVRTLAGAFATGETVGMAQAGIGISEASFVGRNPLAAETARQSGAQFVTQVTRETQKAIRTVVADSISEGIPPRDAARLIEPLIGLTERQAKAVQNLEFSLLDAGRSVKSIAAEAAEYASALLGQRAELIARTEIMSALNEGQQTGWEVAEALGFIRGDSTKVWITAPDDRLCEDCESMDGVSVGMHEAFDTPWGPLDGPPGHPNCLLEDSLVLPSSRITATSERRYDGDAVIVSMASGRELACTPNHPILTPRGWVAARLLHIGAHVLGDGRREWRALGHEDHEQMPSRAQDLAHAAIEAHGVATAAVPVAAEDFHGDGRQSHVAVIRTNRILREGVEAEGAEHVDELAFVMADADLIAEATGRNTKAMRWRVVSPAHCRVCGRHLLRPLRRRQGRPLQPFGFALRTPRNAAREESPVDRSATDAEVTRQLIRGCASEVTLDQVVRINAQAIHGQVYNFETVNGWYGANGIITHNCRCALGLEPIQVPIGPGAEGPVPEKAEAPEIGVPGHVEAATGKGFEGGVVPAPTPEWLRPFEEPRRGEPGFLPPEVTEIEMTRVSLHDLTPSPVSGSSEELGEPGEHVNPVLHIFDTPDGKEWAFKPIAGEKKYRRGQIDYVGDYATLAEREVLAARVRDAWDGLTFPMPTETQMGEFNGERGVLQSYTNFAGGAGRYDITPTERGQMAAFDAVIGNLDRHRNNAGRLLSPITDASGRVHKKGETLAFDHGYAFGKTFPNSEEADERMLRSFPMFDLETDDLSPAEQRELAKGLRAIDWDEIMSGSHLNPRERQALRERADAVAEHLEAGELWSLKDAFDVGD